MPVFEKSKPVRSLDFYIRKWLAGYQGSVKREGGGSKLLELGTFLQSAHAWVGFVTGRRAPRSDKPLRL